MEAASPKMSRAQAKLFWKHLTPEQKRDFNQMMTVLEDKGTKKHISKVTVDDNEQIQRIIIDTDKPSKPIEPFLSRFHVPPNSK